MSRTLTGEDTHPAIAAIAEEESHWETMHLISRPKERTIEVVRIAEGSYFRRDLDGYAEIEGIEQRLAAVETEFISREDALELRKTHDAQWAIRPVVQGVLHQLLEADFFHEKSGGLLGISLSDRENPDMPDFTLSVGRLGELGLRMDFHRQDPNPKLIHMMELVLPRGTSRCEITLQTPERLDPSVHINGSIVTGRFMNALELLQVQVANADLEKTA